jgi:hypothetical protein
MTTPIVCSKTLQPNCSGNRCTYVFVFDNCGADAYSTGQGSPGATVTMDGNHVLIDLSVTNGNPDVETTLISGKTPALIVGEGVQASSALLSNGYGIMATAYSVITGATYEYSFQFNLGSRSIFGTLSIPTTSRIVLAANSPFAIQELHAHTKRLMHSNNSDQMNQIQDELNCLCCGGESDPNNPNKVRAPRVYATVQTTLTNSDIAQAVFTVCDDFNYEKYKLKHSKCNENRFIPRSSVITSEFNQMSPSIYPIVEGKGSGLIEKVSYLRAKGKNVFFGRLIAYAMLKYGLARFMYGNFSTRYLLRSFNSKFFKDLQAGRFCRFMEFFEKPEYEGYYRYFK